MKRLDDHIVESLKPVEEQTNQLKCAAISAILREHNAVPYEIEFFENEDDAFDRERELIALHGRQIDGSGILTNIAKGGRCGYHKGKPVYQFDLDGNIIKEHRSMASAARELTVTTSALWKVFNESSQSTQCGGFLWSKTPELTQKAVDAVRNRKKQPKAVYSVDVNGAWTEYPNMLTAAKQHGVHLHAIRSALQNSESTCCDLHWTFDSTISFTVLEEMTKTGAINRYLSTSDAARKLNGSQATICRVKNGTLKSYKSSVFVEKVITYSL